MAIVALDPRLGDLVELDSEPEKIGSGFIFTEGPVWQPRERHLTFSDVRGDVMYRWTEAGGVTTYRKPSAVSNGNTYDHQGRLITCEHLGRRVSRTNLDGSVETVVSHYEGKQLNSPNDVIVLSNGDLVFTDPPYGLRRREDGTLEGQEIPFHGVYRLSAADGSIRLLVDDFDRPNGLVVSADERRLWVCDTARHHVRVFDVTVDGSLSNGREFADVTHGDSVGRPDGMKMDSLGNLYVTANTIEGVWVFSPSGEHLGFIGLGEGPANCAWGGDDWQTLFVTASTSVFRLRMKVAGQPIVLK